MAASIFIITSYTIDVRIVHYWCKGVAGIYIYIFFPIALNEKLLQYDDKAGTFVVRKLRSLCVCLSPYDQLQK
jgi:hypothetical protein